MATLLALTRALSPHFRGEKTEAQAGQEQGHGYLQVCVPARPHTPGFRHYSPYGSTPLPPVHNSGEKTGVLHSRKGSWLMFTCQPAI